MTNEYELADDSRESLIWTKEQLVAPLLPGMEAPPHPMRLGDTEEDYYRLGASGVAGAERDADDAGRPRTERRSDAPRGAGRRRGRRPPRRSRSGCWPSSRSAAALGMILARKAVHCAVLLAVVMLSLAVLYAMQGAPFLAFVQVIVYTGAVLMLFLFVLMIVGVSSADSIIETIRGQRLSAGLAGIACWCC